MAQKRLGWISTWWLCMIVASLIMGCLRYSFHIDIPLWLVTLPLWITPAAVIVFICIFACAVIGFFIWTNEDKHGTR